MGITCDECGIDVEDDYHKYDGEIFCDECYNERKDEEQEDTEESSPKRNLSDEINEFYWGKKS